MQSGFRWRLPLFARIIFALVSFGAFSSMLGLDVQPAAAAPATTTTLKASSNPSAYGQTVTFTAAVTGGSSPTGTVTFTDTANGYTNTLGTADLTSGIATFGTAYLAGGSHQIVASYAGDAANSASTSPALIENVTLISTTSALTSTPNPSTYGQAISFNANISGSYPSGYVTFTDTTTSAVLGSPYMYGGATGGTAGITTSTAYGVTLLSAGTHQITASYTGNLNSSASVSPPLKQVIGKAVTSLLMYSTLNPSIFSQSSIVVASVISSASAPATGTITFTVDGMTQAAVFNGYSASYDASSLPPGTHTITAAYSGDSNFTDSASQPFTQTVTAHVNPQYVSPSGNDSNDGSKVHPKQTIAATISAAINGDTVIVGEGTYTGPGNVDLDFGGKNLAVTSQNGAATTIIDCGGSASANHRGFYLHSGETSAVISGFTIQNGQENDGGGVYCGGSVSISGCIFKNDAASYDGGGIRIYGGAGGTVSITNCVFTGNTAAQGGGVYCYNYNGTTTVTNCTFTGNASSDGSTYGGGIYNLSTGGVVTLLNDIFYGDTGGGELGNTGGIAYQNSYYTITTCDVQGSNAYGGNLNADPLFFAPPLDLHLQAYSPCLGAGTAAGAPATTLDGRARGSSPSIGAYEAAVTGPAYTTTALKSSLNPSVYSQPVTFSASVTSTLGTPTGTMTFTVDGIVQAHTALSGGKADYATSSLTGGTHAVAATYSGDASFNSSQSTVLTQTVNALSTATTLTSSLNPSTYGQDVVLTATITGPAVGVRLFGQMTFTDTATGLVLGTRNVFSGTTREDFAGLSVGSHPIVVSYSGDGNYGPSSSPALTQRVVQAAAETALTSSANPSVAGQSVTFTALVTTASLAVPTGSVTFSVDGIAQPPTTLSQNLAAAYSTSALTAGSHVITAAYSGDAGFSAGTSAALTQKVNPHVSPQYVSPSGSDSNSGTQSAPKFTIQAAINATLSGDTVLVGDGTYTGPGNVDLDFGGRNITVTSQNGPTKTIIDCGGSVSVDHRGFNLHSGETNAVISGLTIENAEVGGSFPGSANYPGGAISSYGGLTVQYCIIRNNTAGLGGGIYLSLNGGTASVINCVFTGNTAGSGGGLYLRQDGTGVISVVNCTLTGNTAISTGRDALGGAVAAYAYPYPYQPTTSPISLTNTIIYGDTGGEVVYSGQTAYAPVAINCNIQGGYAGTGNINADPIFVIVPGMGGVTDLHLGANSPCLGAGTAAGAPALTIDGAARPNPPSIGAYEAAMTGTTTTLTSSVNPSVAGQKVTFTAAVSGTGGTPTGSVVFTLDGTAQAPVPLAGGSAAFSTASLTVGTHTLTAAYTGDQFNTSSASVVLTQTVNAVPVPQSYQIDAGGGASSPFAADMDFSGGSTYTTSAGIDTSLVQSPAPSAVYQSERYGNFTYTLPNLTPGASYSLRLHFAEIYWNAAGQRVFNVAVNGTTVLPNFDIFAAAGGTNKAVVETIPVTVGSSGTVTITFTTIKDNAKLSGLELLPSSTSTVPTVPIGLAATPGNTQVTLSWTGSPAAATYIVYRGTVSGSETLLKSGLPTPGYTDTGLTNGTTYFYQVAAVNSAGTSAKSGEVSSAPAVSVYQIDAGGSASSPFSADMDFSGGSTYSTSAPISTAGVTGPAPQAVYQSERYGNFTYTLPNLTAGGAYTLRLHFAEIWFNSANQRLFNVSVNGTSALTNFDVFAAAGGSNKAVVKSFPVTADSSGKLTVVFTSVKDNAKLSGLELLK